MAGSKSKRHSASFLRDTHRSWQWVRHRNKGQSNTQPNINTPKELGLQFSSGRTPSVLKYSFSTSPHAHKYNTSMLQWANIREIFWAEVKARTVLFLHGFPAVVQVGRGGDVYVGKEVSVSLYQVLKPASSPKEGRRNGMKEALGKSLYLHN